MLCLDLVCYITIIACLFVCIFYICVCPSLSVSLYSILCTVVAVPLYAAVPLYILCTVVSVCGCALVQMYVRLSGYTYPCTAYCVCLPVRMTYTAVCCVFYFCVRKLFAVFALFLILTVLCCICTLHIYI